MANTTSTYNSTIKLNLTRGRKLIPILVKQNVLFRRDLNKYQFRFPSTLNYSLNM